MQLYFIYIYIYIDKILDEILDKSNYHSRSHHYFELISDILKRHEDIKTKYKELCSVFTIS